MANATFATEGYEGMLLAFVEGCDLHVKLYTNDPDIVQGMTSDQFVQPVYAGYVSTPLTRWTPPVFRGATAFTVHDIVPFRWTTGPAPLPIRGYYVTHGPNGKVAWARRRPGDAYPLGPDSPLILLYVRMDFPPAV